MPAMAEKPVAVGGQLISKIRWPFFYLLEKNSFSDHT
jgi:hypothetical protein